MLQNIRKNSQGTVAKVIVFLIVGSFATFGIQSILVGSGNIDVAEINDKSISAAELQQAINVQKRRLLSTFGDQINPAMLEDKMLQGPALENLIQQKINLGAASDADITVGSDALNLEISQMSEFSENGVFSTAVYQNLLANNGYSPALFHKLLKEERIMQHLNSGLAGTEFVTELELALTAKISQEVRDLRYLIITVDSQKQQLRPTADQISAFYDVNISQFMTEETVKLDYIELKTRDFYPEISEETLFEEYQLRVADHSVSKERKLSHILLEQGALSNEEIIKNINDIRNIINEGSDFSTLAKQYSDDKSSSENGGDLGFTNGDIFPAAIESALIDLELMAVSEPVKTDAGWHLLQLTEINTIPVPSFAELRVDILSELQHQSARTALVNSVENLRDQVFNASDLVGPGAETDLNVAESETLTRAPLGTGLFAEPRLLEAAFSDDVLREGHNSDVIELDADHFVVLRVKEHTTPEPMALKNVTPRIIAMLTDETAKLAVHAQAIEILSQLRGGSTVEVEALAYNYDWQVELGVLRDSNVLPPVVIRKIFSLVQPEIDGSFFDFATLTNGDVLVFELDRVIEGHIDRLTASRAFQLQKKIILERSNSVNRQYQQTLRERADVQVL